MLVGVYFKLQLLHPDRKTTYCTLWICRTSLASWFYKSIDSLPINVRTASTRWKERIHETIMLQGCGGRGLRKTQAAGKKIKGPHPPLHDSNSGWLYCYNADLPWTEPAVWGYQAETCCVGWSSVSFDCCYTFWSYKAWPTWMNGAIRWCQQSKPRRYVPEFWADNSVGSRKQQKSIPPGNLNDSWQVFF